MRLIILAALLQSTLVCAISKTSNPVFLLYTGCQSAVGKVKFGFNATSHALCAYPPATGTMAVCLRQYATNALQYEQAVAHFLYSTCGDAFLNVSYDTIYSNATEHLINSTSLGLNVSTPQYAPVTIPAAQYLNMHDAYRIYYDTSDYAHHVGYASVGYWFMVMIFSMVSRFIKRTGIVTLCNGLVARFWQRYVTLPSLVPWGKRSHLGRTTLVGGLLPKRSDGIALLGYYVVHASGYIGGWEFDSNNVLYGARDSQAAKYIAMRGGRLAFAQLPLLILFAGRNNVLSLLSGFSYDSFVQFHKHTGRMVVWDTIVHAAGYSYMYAASGTYTSHMGLSFIQWGVFGTVAAGVILGFSHHWIRVHYYEVFLYGHIVGASCFVVGAWRHCMDLGSMEWLYAAVAVWAFERLVRIVRICCFGFRRSSVNLVDGETMQITIEKPSDVLWSAAPGQYVYCYFMLPSCFWQSHPFTVIDTADNLGTITLYVKRKKGATNKAYEAVLSNKNLKVLVEGPYGESSPNQFYDNIVLVAGGNGFPGPYSHAYQLASRGLSNCKNVHLYWVSRNLGSVEWFFQHLVKLSKANVQVTLCLTRETTENLLDYSHHQLNSQKLSSPQLNSQKFDSPQLNKNYSPFLEKPSKFHNITVDVNSILDNDSEITAFSPEKTNILNHFNIQLGKPNFDNVVLDFLTNTKGSISFTSCGPPALCDSLRNAIASNLDAHQSGRVEYFEESQIW